MGAIEPARSPLSCLAHESFAVFHLYFQPAVGFVDAAAPRPKVEQHAFVGQIGLASQVQFVLAAAAPDIAERCQRGCCLQHIAVEVITAPFLCQFPGGDDRVGALCLAGNSAPAKRHECEE